MVLMWKTSVAQARGEMVGFLLESGQRMWQKRSKDAVRNSSTTVMHTQLVVNQLLTDSETIYGEPRDRLGTGCSQVFVLGFW